jgi:hypothetical protein
MTAVRRMQLARLGVWIALATVAVLTVVLTARTETGIRRIATLITPAPPETGRSAKAPTQQIASRQADQEAEQRRLSETVRVLAADRDRLLARLSTLERTVEDVTGSIPPAAASSKAAPATPVVAAPLPALPSTAQPNAAASNRIAAGHLATGSPSALESVATRTEFGVDVGGNTSLEGLRSLWTNLKMTQPALFEGLRPLITVREGAKPGAIELRLVAGPLPNASIAARLCATLTAAGQTCQPAVFDGQRLALQ